MVREQDVRACCSGMSHRVERCHTARCAERVRGRTHLFAHAAAGTRELAVIVTGLILFSRADSNLTEGVQFVRLYL